MSTLPPPVTKHFPDDSLEKKVYNIVDKFKEHIPIANDRNRLGFNLYKYAKGEGDHPSILVTSAKLKIEGISVIELADKITSEIEKLKV